MTFDPLQRPDIGQINQCIEYWDQIMSESKVRWRLSTLPAGMQGPLTRYVVFGVPTGKFLKAVLSNDLENAARAGNDYHSKHLFENILTLYDLLPRESHGSEKIYVGWLKGGGLFGRAK